MIAAAFENCADARGVGRLGVGGDLFIGQAGAQADGGVDWFGVDRLANQFDGDGAGEGVKVTDRAEPAGAVEGGVVQVDGRVGGKLAFECGPADGSADRPAVGAAYVIRLIGFADEGLVHGRGS